MPSPYVKAVTSFAIAVSIFGLAFTSAAMLSRPTILDFTPYRKPLAGGVFASICILGALAVLFPKECSTGLHASKMKVEPKALKTGPNNCTIPRRKGHHPDCGRYGDHVITLGNHCLCAACTGLLVGAIIALCGAFLYFFLNLNIRGINLPLVLIGQVGIVVGLVQFRFKHYIRAFANSYFTVAALLILVGVDDALGSTFIDLYYILLIVFWLSTRILVSGWDHERICRKCPDQCGLTA